MIPWPGITHVMNAPRSLLSSHSAHYCQHNQRTQNRVAQERSYRHTSLSSSLAHRSKPFSILWEHSLHEQHQVDVSVRSWFSSSSILARFRHSTASPGYRGSLLICLPFPTSTLYPPEIIHVMQAFPILPFPFSTGQPGSEVEPMNRIHPIYYPL